MFKRTYCLSVLLIGIAAALTGCGVPRSVEPVMPAVAQAPEPAIRDGYVDLRLLVRLHPATEELDLLDEQIRRLRARETPTTVSALAAPNTRVLPPLEPLNPPSDPSRWPDRRRALQELREEAAVDALAQPDPAGDWYEAEIARLRREARSLREEAPPPPRQADFEASRRRAEAHRQLSNQLEVLREQPHDTFFYSPAQLRRRRELFRLVEEELERLRQEHLLEMELALAPPPTSTLMPPAPRIDAENLEQARRERDRRRAEASRERRDREREQTARVLDAELPPLQATAGPIAGSEQTISPAEPMSEFLALEVETANARPLPSMPVRGKIDTALSALRRQQRELQEWILDDVKTAALAVGHKHAVRVTFDRGKAPDRTRELIGGIRETLSPQQRRRQGRR